MVGPYQKVTLLGKGGMGEVWEAVDSRTQRTVALKVLTSVALADPELRKRFVREMRLAAEIENPYVVAVYDFSVGPPPYIAMRLIRGRNLATEIRTAPLTPERAVDIIQQVANALAAAHDKNLRHRDVKPSNILLDAGHRSGSDHAYLIDWGIAHRIDPHDPNITRVGQLVGTPPYIAPERLTDQTADHRADIYSLAVVLYECLAGRVPYGPTGLSFPLHAHLTDEPRDLPDTVPVALQDVIAKGLAKDPDQRWASATEFGEAAYLAVHPAPEPRTRKRSWWPAAGAVAGAATGGVLLGADLIAAWWVVPALAVAGAGLTWGFTPSKEGNA
ncbi:serine/threonine-protein kinase [Actinoplanes sp. L3-i22]|uniref:serine/threonine-protein kinase n=1 Tax=Actinoplanes sp. L3-i22 TaxID=2836373 RepID=UPI00210323ED|nr:serine/threonine-protein kinase [Actinoplanes sp. L3-i22]